MSQSYQTNIRHAPRGFTLIELLVVISIIGMLAGILFPVFSSIRNRGRQLVCANNLKQLGFATRLYAGDYKGYLPAPTDDMGVPNVWYNALAAYGASNTVASSSQTIMQDPIRNSFSPTSRVNWRTLKMNRKLCGNRSEGTSINLSAATPSYRCIADVSQASTTPLFFDGRCADGASKSTADYNRYDGWEVYAELRHAGKSANILFVDGHVEAWRQGTPNPSGGWTSDSTSLTWWVE